MVRARPRLALNLRVLQFRVLSSVRFDVRRGRRSRLKFAVVRQIGVCLSRNDVVLLLRCVVVVRVAIDIEILRVDNQVVIDVEAMRKRTARIDARQIDQMLIEPDNLNHRALFAGCERVLHELRVEVDRRRRIARKRDPVDLRIDFNRFAQ